MTITVSAELETQFGELSETERRLFQLLAERLEGKDLDALEAELLPGLADRMAAALPDDPGWDRLIGPVYSTAGLERWLGISRQAISQQAKARRLLRLMTADGAAVYPGFQFDTHGRRLPGLKAVLEALAEGIDDPWTWAIWLNSATGGTTAAELLRQGKIDEVVAQARADAAAWGAP